MKLTIPAVPPSLNKLLRMHWAAKLKLKNTWLLLVQSQLPQVYLKPMVKTRVTVTMNHSRFFDKDNAYGAAKVIFDSLKHYRLIYDDNPQYLEQIVEQGKCKHKERHTVIEFEYLGGQ